MRTRLIVGLLMVCVLGLSQPGQAADEVKRKPLTPKQQEAFLNRRMPGGLVGRFGSYASLAFALHDIALHTESEAISDTRLADVYPKSYKPTRRQWLDVLARQTRSQWSYDTKRDYWVFSKPAAPLPFTSSLAKGWQREDRGLYLYHKPPGAPVGMDVYLFGQYSFDKDATAELAKLRLTRALSMAKPFKKDATEKDMKPAKVGDLPALYFESPTPRPGWTWRQWSLVADGHLIVIVSVIEDNNAKALLADVQGMVKSFKMTGTDKATPTVKE